MARRPTCGCANHHGPDYKQGVHSDATWDCPLRNWAKWGSCPGFLASGHRDATKWVGYVLTRAAKDEWLALIQVKNLPLPGPKNPNTRNARAPPFHL